MSTVTNAEIAETMRQVAADCKTDAYALDGTPLTGRAVGENFGNTLAMLATVARAVAMLSERIDNER